MKQVLIKLPPECYDVATHGDHKHHKIFAAVILELAFLAITFQYVAGDRGVWVKESEAAMIQRMIARWVLLA